MKTYKAKVEITGLAGVELKEYVIEANTLNSAILKVHGKMGDRTYDIKEVVHVVPSNNPAQEGIDAAQAQANSKRILRDQLQRFSDFILDSHDDDGRIFETEKDSVEFLRSGMEFFCDMESESEE